MSEWALSELSPGRKWSVYAGVYGSLAAFVLLLVLHPVSGLLVELLGLPAESSVFLMAAPVPVIGAGVWWWVVERRNAYSYLWGGVVGFVTALATAISWVLLFVLLWGPSLVVAGGVLVVFVLVVVGPAAFVAGLPLMYGRRRQGGVTGDDGGR